MGRSSEIPFEGCPTPERAERAIKTGKCRILTSRFLGCKKAQLHEGFYYCVLCEGLEIGPADDFLSQDRPRQDSASYRRKWIKDSFTPERTSGTLQRILKIHLSEILNSTHNILGDERHRHLRSVLLHESSIKMLTRAHRSFSRKYRKRLNPPEIEKETCRKAVITAIRVLYPALLKPVVARIPSDAQFIVPSRNFIKFFKRFQESNRKTSRRTYPGSIEEFRKLRYVRPVSLPRYRILSIKKYTEKPLIFINDIKKGKIRGGARYRNAMYIVCWGIFASGLNLDKIGPKYTRTLVKADPRAFLSKAIGDRIWKKLAYPYNVNIRLILENVYPSRFKEP